MERRDFVGALAAIFCGVLLPEPVRETIRVANFNEVIALGSPDSPWSQLHHFGGGVRYVRISAYDYPNNGILEGVAE